MTINFVLIFDAVILLELPLPEDVNIFYALDLRDSASVELVVRYKT